MKITLDIQQREPKILGTWVTVSPRLMCERESNPRPFSVWGKCGENGFPQGDAENGGLRPHNVL
jgi:hypothetical protein